MKNILVPIDFSEASFNAVSYAAYLANAFKAQLTLLHAYTGTAAFDESNSGTVYDSEEELEAANEKFLKKEMDKVAKKFTVKIASMVMKGNPVNVIDKIAGKINPEIIVLGMKGKGESNSRFGSTTTKMITRTAIPLLVIPKKAGYQAIDTIAFASDFKNEKLLSDFSVLKQFITRFDPFIEILNVQKKKDLEPAQKMIAGKLNADLTGNKYNYSFNLIEKEDVEEGINKFLKNHPTDMLIMVARKRNFMEEITEPSHTKKMTGLTKIPLLVLHG